MNLPDVSIEHKYFLIESGSSLSGSLMKNDSLHERNASNFKIYQPRK